MFKDSRVKKIRSSSSCSYNQFSSSELNTGNKYSFVGYGLGKLRGYNDNPGRSVDTIK